LIDPKELNQTIGRIALLLRESSIPFHLTGGLISSFYGEPRLTQDIDVVLRLGPGGQLDSLVLALQKDFFIDEIAAANAVLEQRMFQALDRKTMIKVDFHVGEMIPGELDRSRNEEILPGISTKIVSKEDAILSKLLWIKKGSHKSRQDVQMMLSRKGPLDSDYLNRQAIALGVIDLLRELEPRLPRQTRTK
jgi:hypothetical protein